MEKEILKLEVTGEELLQYHIQVQETELIELLNKEIRALKKSIEYNPFSLKNKQIEMTIVGFIYDEALEKFETNLENVGYSVKVHKNSDSVYMQFTYQ